MSVKFKIELSSPIIEFSYSLELKVRLTTLLNDCIQPLKYQDEWTITFRLTLYKCIWAKDIDDTCIGVYKNELTI